jgi:hypothetical protein
VIISRKIGQEEKVLFMEKERENSGVMVKKAEARVPVERCRSRLKNIIRWILNKFRGSGQH